MKTIISSILVITLLAMPVWSMTLPYFKISKAYITPLDSDSYRLRVETEYGGDNFWDPAGSCWYTGNFNHFSLTPLLGSSQYNPTLNAGVNDQFPSPAYNNPGDWMAGYALHMPFPFAGGRWDGGSTVFGYDFDQPGPITGPLNIDYHADFWGWPVFEEESYWHPHVSFSGTVSVSVIPEPTTLLLFGLGFVGICGVKRFR